MRKQRESDEARAVILSGMRHRYLVPLLLIVTLAACRSTGAPTAHAASLDQEVLLAPKEQATYASQGLTVEFVRVVEDSRCPKDTTCVWAGEVKVEIATRVGSAAAVQQHQIKSGESATAGKFQVMVVNVQPEKLSTREIPQEEYRVTVKVEQSQQ
jgi:hypothetical protein